MSKKTIKQLWNYDGSYIIHEDTFSEKMQEEAENTRLIAPELYNPELEIDFY